MITYVIRKAQCLERQPSNIASAPWCIYRDHGDKLLCTRIGNYRTRKAAVTVARLLAGWSGHVLVERN